MLAAAKKFATRVKFLRKSQRHKSVSVDAWSGWNKTCGHNVDPLTYIVGLLSVRALFPCNRDRGSRMSMGRLMFLVVSATTLGIVSPAQAQDATAGKRLFTMNCSACHSPKPGQNLVGPSLFNVINRHSGQIPNFHYSQANVNSGLTWNVATSRSLSDCAARARAGYEDDIPRPEGRKAAGRCDRVSRNAPLTRDPLPLRIPVFIAALSDCARVATRANAVPAFAQQTGEPCTTCHIGGFGPQLTPFGRAFKIGGYTQTGGEGLASKIPLSAFVISSFTNTQAGQPGGAAPHFGDNNNAAFDQVSVFLAGRITDYAGGFVQGTYSGVDRTFFLDNTDLRLTTRSHSAIPNCASARH